MHVFILQFHARHCSSFTHTQALTGCYTVSNMHRFQCLIRQNCCNQLAPRPFSRIYVYNLHRATTNLRSQSHDLQQQLTDAAGGGGSPSIIVKLKFHGTDTYAPIV